MKTQDAWGNIKMDRRGNIWINITRYMRNMTSTPGQSKVCIRHKKDDEGCGAYWFEWDTAKDVPNEDVPRRPAPSRVNKHDHDIAQIRLREASMAIDAAKHSGVRSTVISHLQDAMKFWESRVVATDPKDVYNQIDDVMYHLHKAKRNIGV